MKPQPGDHPLKRNYKRESNAINQDADPKAVARRRKLENREEIKRLQELGYDITEEDLND